MNGTGLSAYNHGGGVGIGKALGCQVIYFFLRTKHARPHLLRPADPATQARRRSLLTINSRGGRDRIHGTRANVWPRAANYLEAP